LGEGDGETNDGVESHQPGTRQRMGPAGTENIVMRDEREGGSICVLMHSSLELLGKGDPRPRIAFWEETGRFD
jgi:hypothetical protein